MHHVVSRSHLMQQPTIYPISTTKPTTNNLDPRSNPQPLAHNHIGAILAMARAASGWRGGGAPPAPRPPPIARSSHHGVMPKPPPSPS